MTSLLGAALDFYRGALDARAYRQQVLAGDIANASTPGFKAVDVNFKRALALAEKHGPPNSLLLRVDNSRQIEAAGKSNGLGSAVEYQRGVSASLDGNTVDMDREQVQSGENGVAYEAAASFLGGQVNLLLTAIRGNGTRGGG